MGLFKMEERGIITILLVVLLMPETFGYRHFYHGRPRKGFLLPPVITNQDTLHHLPNEQWFQQKLDHFNSANMATWKQRYFVNATFYKPGSAIFVMIGGEGEANPVWMVEGQWINYAHTFNAMCLMLEHRFYGKSHPTSDMSVENLKYLSSEQALADLAHFISSMRQQMDVPPDTRVITFGGSYPGSLSAWFRLKYPHIAYGAVATSAPIVAQIDFQQYLEVVGSSLRQSSNGAQCVSNIQSAMQHMAELLKSANGTAQLYKMFKLCDVIDTSNTKDIQNLFSVITDNFNGVVQYNMDNREFEGAVGTNITIETVCGIMSANTSLPITNLATVNSLILSAYNESCADYKYSNMIDELKLTAWNSSAAEGGRQWTYQTCTEFGFYQSSDSQQQPFGQHFPVNFSVSQCGDIFGPALTPGQLQAGVLSTNERYGGRNLTVTRVLLPNGSVDPWHALGVTRDLAPSVTAIYINGTAHCANMYPARADDPVSLRSARQEIVETLARWLH